MGKLKIVFMGTPDFAVPSLKQLVEAGQNIVGVITAPDKPAGRGRKLKASPVKAYAQSRGLEILQPTNLKDPAFQAELKDLGADLFIVVAFRMLPKSVWQMPPLGTFNLHASLLPRYRGAAPINWAIMNGETETGLTTFFLKHEIDTGSLLLQEKEPIYLNDTAGSLYERLMHKGAGLVLETVELIASGRADPKAQEESEDLPHAPKIFTETCEIDWNRPANDLYNHIRGLSPYPAAWFTLEGKRCKVFWAEPLQSGLKLDPGTFETDNKTYWFVGTGTEALSLKEVQLAGKKRMDTETFLRGYQLKG